MRHRQISRTQNWTADKRPLMLEQNQKNYVEEEQPNHPQEVAITVIAAVIILIAFIAVALLT